MRSLRITFDPGEGTRYLWTDSIGTSSISIANPSKHAQAHFKILMCCNTGAPPFSVS